VIWYERCERGADTPKIPDSLEVAMAYERVPTIEETLQRVQGEFREMPGLRLTSAQASRLWGLDAISSQALLEALVDARFLRRTPDGAFMRPNDTERVMTARG
jgi:hypothetical protein